MSISVEQRGRRYYLMNAPFGVKDTLKGAGCKWDPDARAWWTGKAELAAELARAATTDSPQETAGLETQVSARVEYKGRAYYWCANNAGPVRTQDSNKYLLTFTDGSKTFWAQADLVSVLKMYRDPIRISGLRAYADRMRGARQEGLLAPRGQSYECPECGDYVTSGHGTCWETGAPH